jgi:2-octaprenyl-6-methoxyphenol hydroxylase
VAKEKKEHAEEAVDVLIIGGGPIGAALLLALEGHDYKVRMVESLPFEHKISPDFDARTLALSMASVRILEMLAIWPLLEPKATPIHSIHVSEQGRFAQTRLEREDGPNDALGYVIEMQHILQAMHTLLDYKKLIIPAKLIALDRDVGLATIQHQEKERKIRAKIIVAADGTESTVRSLTKMSVERKFYCQQAITANIGLKRSHGSRAYERFTQEGPLALLPMSNQRSALVWALTPKHAKELMGLEEGDFLKHLQRAFGYRLGRFTQVGKRVLFPLVQTIMPEPVAPPIVFIGNAAQTLHPVAGQGFNLGLRDAATLAQCLIQYGPNEHMLQSYQAMRRYDQVAIRSFTDGLVRLFTSQWKGLAWLRALGLLTIDQVLPLQRLVTQHASGFRGQIPDLACGIPLAPEK